MRILRAIHRTISFIFSRIFLVGVLIVLQIGIIFGAIMYFGYSATNYYLFFHILSFFVVFFVVARDDNPAYKITWIGVILAFPLVGGVFYLVFGNKRMPKKLVRLINNTAGDISDYLDACESPGMKEEIVRLNPQLLLQSRYIENITGSSLCADTSSFYFSSGEAMFDAMTKELKKAKKFIMLEYFIIRPGYMWDSVFAILRQKVREGVDVYMIYDDFGNIFTLPEGYDKVIRSGGIKLSVFNPLRPRISPIMNHRDHRKIMVIDSVTGFCGGINLADEYINRKDRFGHWKDTGVMLKGEAVWEFTLLFLQQWQFSTGTRLDFEKFRGESGTGHTDGLVQVFGDSPLDEDNVSETAYLNIISRATKYVYITTPYLVIDFRMEQALQSAAASGIDVRIITPYRYDKA